MRNKMFLRSSLAVALTLAFSANSEGTNDDINEDHTVIVYGQRVERDIINVPVSMDSVDGETIERHRMELVSDVVKTIPNINVFEPAGDYSYFQVRGLPRHIEQPNVPIYVDGIPHTSLYGLNLPLLDVENIEFLRGPQGNLFGSNARDGVVVINTKRPINETTGSVSVGVANFNQKSFSGGFNVPIIEDELYTKLAIRTLQRDGFVENTYLNEDIDHKKETVVNLGFYWEPSATVAARLNFDYLDKEHGITPYVNTTGKTLSNGDDLEGAMEHDGIFDQTSKGVSLGIDWDLWQDWKLSSVTGFRQQDIFANIDADLTVSDPAFSAYIDNWFDERDYFQELRLASTPEVGNWDWLFGLAYFRATDDNRQAIHSVAMNMDSVKVDSDLARDTYTAYLDTTWRFLPSWRLNVGARYTREHFDADSTFFSAFAGGETQGSYNNTFSEFLPKLALSKHFGDEHTVYASYGEGMLSGGATWMYEYVTPEGRTGHVRPYAPETSRMYEVGYKGYWLERSVMTSLAIFDSYVYDHQLFYPDAVGNFQVSSVDEVRSRGIEGSIKAWFADAWETVLSFGFNDAKVVEIDGYSGASLTKGSRIPYAPEHNIHASVIYYGDISDDWQYVPTLSADRFGEVLLNNAGTIKQEPYTIFDANVEFIYRDDYSIRLWGRNISDERYRTQSFNFGQEVSIFGDPRQFGIDFKAKF